MPLAGEAQEHIALVDFELIAGFGAEHPPALGNVNKLVFIQDPPPLGIEKVARGMACRGILLPGSYGLCPDTTHNKPPVPVFGACDKILVM